jgi:hypothetical protein
MILKDALLDFLLPLVSFCHLPHCEHTGASESGGAAHSLEDAGKRTTAKIVEKTNYSFFN